MKQLSCVLTALVLAASALQAQQPAVAPAAPRKLTLVDRAGNRTLLGDVPGNTNGPRVSPDGARLFYDSTAEHLAWRRVGADDPGEEIWTPVRAPESRSPDGKTLSYVVSIDNKFSAWTMNLETRERTQIPDGPEAIGTQISPDGRWIAYQSTATGMHEIYVRPLGRAGDAVKATAQNGAFRPQWSADMRDLFFDTVDNGVRTLWVVPVRVTADAFTVGGEPQKLPITGFVQAGVGRRMYDLLPDGRWVMMFP